jgi:hypothetical protein
MSTILPQNRNVTHAVPKKGSERTAFVWNSENGSLSSYIVFNVPITKHYKIKNQITKHPIMMKALKTAMNRLGASENTVVPW